VNGKEFTRRARRLARRKGERFTVVSKRGKGGHQTAYFGRCFTTVKTGEIGIGLLRKMCRDLGIDPEDL